jgi:hypothetical protein
MERGTEGDAEADTARIWILQRTVYHGGGFTPYLQRQLLLHLLPGGLVAVPDLYGTDPLAASAPRSALGLRSKPVSRLETNAPYLENCTKSF